MFNVTKYNNFHYSFDIALELGIVFVKHNAPYKCLPLLKVRP